MPRSIFLGRPMPGPGEPLWTEEDRAWALAHLAEESSRCECGHPVDESMATENEYAYEATVETCFACKAREKAAAEFRDAGEGLKSSVRRRG